MKQFTLAEPTPVLLSNVNVRSELHGKEHVPAVDLKFSATLANTALDDLVPDLREMLYRALRQDERVEQPELEAIEPLTPTPLLRCDELEPLKLKPVLSGYTATVPWGVNDDTAIVLENCSVDAFVVDALQGGSVKLGFRVQAANVSDSALGRLGVMMGQETHLTLAPPRVQATIDGSGA